MNTRIDDALKQGGDAVFAAIGLTPSEVVRSVWEYADRHAEAPAVVATALSRSLEDAPSLETSFRAALARQSSDLVADYRKRIGAPAPDRPDVIDYRAMREDAWGEKLTRGALV